MNTLRDFCVNMAANIVHDFLKPLAVYVAYKILWPHRAVFYAPFVACFEFFRRTYLRIARMFRARPINATPESPPAMPHIFAGPRDHHMQTPHAAVFRASAAGRGYNVVTDSRYPDRAPEITQNNTLTLQSAVPLSPQGPTQPRFVNNSDWMQLQAAQHQRETGMLMAMQAHERELERARFAMQTTMPQYNHALTP